MPRKTTTKKTKVTRPKAINSPDTKRFPRAGAKPKAKAKFPYNILTLTAALIGWGTGLIPKLKALPIDAILPARIVGAVLDHLFGDDDGEESELWSYLMTVKPPAVSDEMHVALRELTECIGRISADITEGVATKVWEGKTEGYEPPTVFRDCRELIDNALDHHGLEVAIQAVMDAK